MTIGGSWNLDTLPDPLQTSRAACPAPWWTSPGKKQWKQWQQWQQWQHPPGGCARWAGGSGARHSCKSPLQQGNSADSVSWKNTFFTKYSSWKSSCLLNKRNIRKLFLSISNKDKSSGKLLRLLFRLHNSLFLLNPCVQVSICPAPGLWLYCN